jgi:Flp pilus assembly protein TadD
MPAPNPANQNALALALQHHRAGRVEEAIAAYRQALALAPDSAEIYNNLGMLLRQQGALAEAIDHYNRAIALRPSLAEAHNNLAIVLRETGKLDAAIAAYRRTLELKPNFAPAWNNLANVLIQTQQLDAAVDALRRAIAIDPNLLEARNNLGGVLRKQGRFDEAVAAYQQAIALRGDFALGYSNLGKALLDQGKTGDAVAALERAVQLQPPSAEALCDLAYALVAADRASDAFDACQKALALEPNFIRAYNNLGIALTKMGRHQQAIAAYRRAIELAPNDAQAHWNLAGVLLLLGDYRQGWVEFEWRRLTPSLPTLRSFPQPMWDGSDLKGKKILLHAEQGFGDSIQFVRYVPLVMQRGGKVILECQKELRKLFGGMEGISADRVIGKGEPLPEFDVQCSLLSLPLVLGTLVDSIPGRVPYLRPDAASAQAWAQKLKGLSGLRVGLVWAGRPKPDPARSANLQDLAALFDLSGISWVLLQTGSASDQAKALPQGLAALNVADQLEDFADTAAVIANLDLVITIDTAAAHLAGAMAKPVWVMLPFVPSWRWLLDRDDSPWYPTMRLFRQTSPGNWHGVAAKVAKELTRWAGPAGSGAVSVASKFKDRGS